MIGPLSTFFKIVIANLLAYKTASAPIRNGGINQVPSPILNPVASPIVNTGAVGALIGGPVFYPPVRINIDPSSQLYIPPGAEGRITLLLKNDGVGDFFFISAMDDRAFPIQFDYPQYGTIFQLISHIRVDSRLLPTLAVILPFRFHFPLQSNTCSSYILL